MALWLMVMSAADSVAAAVLSQDPAATRCLQAIAVVALAAARLMERSTE